VTDVVIVMHAGCCRFLDHTYLTHGYGAANCAMIREGVFEATVPDRELCNLQIDPAIAYVRKIFHFDCLNG
jgi:hypothetical protein